VPVLKPKIKKVSSTGNVELHFESAVKFLKDRSAEELREPVYYKNPNNGKYVKKPPIEVKAVKAEFVSLELLKI